MHWNDVYTESELVHKCPPHIILLLSHISGYSPQISFSENPPPFSSSSLPANIPLKSSALISGTLPLTGAFGVPLLLLFSCPALLGKVGNISVLFGFGSSLKKPCSSTSFAFG